MGRRPGDWFLAGAGALALLPAPLVARAEIYLSPEQAAAAIFPGLKLAQRELTLSDEQAAAIEKASGQTVRNRRITSFVAPDRSAVFIDQVLGKHEQITIAVGVAPDGSAKGVEILEYRESYGSQVRNPEWRKQFLGKTMRSELKVGTDIRNISGATLSSSHVTAGVKRLLQTYETLRPSL